MWWIRAWSSVLVAGVAVAAGTVLAVFIVRVDGQNPAEASDLSKREAAIVVGGRSIAGANDVLTLAKPSREVLIGVAARPGGPVDLLVFGDDEMPLGDSRLRVTVGSGREQILSEQACGIGCFRLSAPVLAGEGVSISVAVVRDGMRPRRALFSLPPRLPPAADATFRNAVRRMRSVRSIRIDETLSAGFKVLRARWLMQAPDRFSVVASDGGKSVLIGQRRWDWIGDRWDFRTYPRTRFPSFNWLSAGNPRSLGRSVVDGKQTQIVSAFNARQAWWYRLWVAEDSLVLKVEMFAASHYMVDRYSGFDKPVSIRPPIG